MKRASQYLFTLLIGALASCQSDPNEVKPVSDNQLLVSIEDIQTRSSLYEDASNKNVKTQWEVGDQIKLYSVHDGHVYSATYSAQEKGSEAKFALDSEETGFNLGEFEAAYYPGENATDYDKDAKKITATIPSTQTYAANSFGNGAAPMTSNVKSGNALYFRNAFSVLKLNLTGNEKISQIRVSAPSLSASTALSGSFDFTLSGSNTVSTAINDNANDAGYEVTLDCSAMTNALTSTATPFYIALPPMPNSTKMTVDVIGNNGIIKSFTTTSGVNSLVQNNIVDMPSLGLPGLFSVSATTKVCFSLGNLQWSSSNGTATATTHTVQGGTTVAGTWRFAEHQYDYVGFTSKSTGNVYGVSGNSSTKCANENIGQNYQGWIDLFGFGTSGYNSKYPYMTSVTSTDYLSENIVGSYINYDWGYYNSISNGGDKPELWRTLTSAEWGYLLNSRANCGDKKGYALITSQDGTTAISVGLVLLPDEWTLPTGLSFVTVSTNNTYSLTGKTAPNTYTLSQWTNMENAGAVFLPITGWRKGSAYPIETTYVNDCYKGYYWSSTFNSGEISNDLEFASGSAPTVDTNYKRSGTAVRLVQDVMPNYGTTQDFLNGNSITLE